MSKFLIPLFLLAASVAFSQDYSIRFVEVSGSSSRLLMATEYNFSVTVIPGESCQIPKYGRNWEKDLKDCKEENNRLIASRQSVLDAITRSFGSRLVVRGENTTSRYGGQSKSFDYSCRDFADYLEFTSKLKEIENAFSSEMQSAYNTTESIPLMDELTTEALKGAQVKAEKMASALGAKIGQPLQIFEDDPIGPGGGGAFGRLMEMEMAKKSYMKDGTYFIPNSKGQLFYEKTVYVRFALLN